MAHIVEHEDIWIESSETLSWKQKFDDTLNYENLKINEGNYTDYKPSKLQFCFVSSIAQQNIKVRINCANRLSNIHGKNAAICRYEESEQQWVLIEHDWDADNKTLSFETDFIGIYGVFINHYWYTSLTQRMADEYPIWTKIRQTKNSAGQLFLNFFGIELETVQDYLEWIQDQKYIQTADLKTLDWIYMYQLPEIKTSDVISPTRFNGIEDIDVTVLESLKEFFYNERNEGGILDYKENKFYTVKNHGQLTFNISNEDSKVSIKVKPTNFHIWNAFDEFGLLVGVERLYLEKNGDYKERILDVFRYPSGTHDTGLTNGIARDLRMIQRKDKAEKYIKWKDDSKDLVLKNQSQKNIDVRTLRIDDKNLREDQFHVDSIGNIRVYALNQNKQHTVSFISDLEKFELFNKTNESLYKIMFQEDGQATFTLFKWVEYINTIAPIMWDRFKWDEGYWDAIDKSLTGLGYVPNIWDSNIEIWKEYKFDSDQ
ncbi:low copy number virion structural protein [Bacillus halotolerans]|uniref:Low copy number virion structural protein n=1 Tax=Bacillus halotolerans TaxID=260554 RepID=A0A9Q4HS10_9BACI|nr:low copy number virion structural protein [Bacillus halotolerans]MCY9186611.1 low copy number virion structural protein [Bacillus halotolerans]